MGALSQFRDSLAKKRLGKDRLKIAGKEPRSSATSLLETPVGNADDLSIQLVMRDNEPDELALALAGAGGLAICRFLDNLPDRGQIMLLADIRYFRDSSTQKIRAAQATIAASFEAHEPS